MIVEEFTKVKYSELPVLLRDLWCDGRMRTVGVTLMQCWKMFPAFFGTAVCLHKNTPCNIAHKEPDNFKFLLI